MNVGEALDLMTKDHQQVTEAMVKMQPALSRFIEALVPRMRAGGRLIYLGAGTSGRLGVLDASECPPTFNSDPDQVVGVIAGGDAALRRSSEAREDDPHGAAEELRELNLTERDTLLGIAAGGTTPYVLGAIDLAAKCGAMTGLLTCAPEARAGANCTHHLLLDTGPELLTGSTRLKAGSATKLALNMITTITFVQLGKVYSNLMVDLRATNDKLADRCLRILIELCPELDRSAALELLAQAEGKLKCAIIMHRREVNLSFATKLLDEHQGLLRPILD